MFALTSDPDARSLADTRGDPHVQRSCAAVVRDRKASGGAVQGVFERQFDLLLDVSSLPRRTGPRTASARAGLLGAAAHPAEERVEEIGERIGVAEHLAHLLFRHRAKSAAASRSGAAAVIDVPAGRRSTAGCAGTGLFIHAPVGAELVVLFSLR